MSNTTQICGACKYKGINFIKTNLFALVYKELVVYICPRCGGLKINIKELKGVKLC